ncbi:MAG: membrane protein [Gemmatales bacterium]|nr:MAG: membrane protein [Gemmatales bacterium]
MVRPWNFWTLGLVAFLLAGLTIWTYLGDRKAGTRRVGLILGLRLFALFLACLLILRPSFAVHRTTDTGSVLLIALDRSASMTIKDEHDNQSRWQALRRLLQTNQQLLEKLEDKHNLTIVVYYFANGVESAKDVSDVRPDGKQTSFRRLLETVYEAHRSDRKLRGLVIVSDGADNGGGNPINLATKWRNLPCPIFTFRLGRPETSDIDRDIAFTDIKADPSPVPVKTQMTVKGYVNATGFEESQVIARLLVDGKEVAAEEFRLDKSRGNEIAMKTDAPNKPGEIRVTLKIEPKKGEVSAANNEISTYVSVTKEGISVLLVDKLRFPEPQQICDALSSDKRIRLYTAWRRTDAPSPADLFQFDKIHYDVIIVGDVSARRFAAGHPEVFQRVHDLVAEKGTGLLVMGGYDAFGNRDWPGIRVEAKDPKTGKKRQVRFADILPVDLDNAGQSDREVQLVPTEEGLQHYILRLADTPAENKKLWRELPKLNGMSILGSLKPGATVLARDAETQSPLMVAHRYGEGRVLAFAGDTTWRWLRLGQPDSKLGVEAHRRFWKQVVLWLAWQDRTEGSIWVLPDTRRLKTGDQLGFQVGARGRGGVDLKRGKFKVEIVTPNGKRVSVRTGPELEGLNRGKFTPEDPGEYRIEVTGEAKEADGSVVAGKAAARFLVYQDEAELTNRAADHSFLIHLADAGGGKSFPAQELTDFLKQLHRQPLPAELPKVDYYPDWGSTRLTPFLPAYLLLFVLVLCLEWFLRRLWGLV